MKNTAFRRRLQRPRVNRKMATIRRAEAAVKHAILGAERSSQPEESVSSSSRSFELTRHSFESFLQLRFCFRILDDLAEIRLIDGFSGAFFPETDAVIGEVQDAIVAEFHGRIGRETCLFAVDPVIREKTDDHQCRRGVGTDRGEDHQCPMMKITHPSKLVI